MKKWIIKHQLSLTIAGIAIAVIGIISLFAWVIYYNHETVEGKYYTPQGEYALLDLGSTNCSPCIKLQPVLAELREEYGETIDVVFFDISNTQEGAALANGYRVNIMPTLLFVNKNGKEIKRIVGFHTREQIEEIFKELGWIQC